jgi:hypothetical protein
MMLRTDARGRDGGVREELAAGVILVCATNRPIGENNSSLDMARVDETRSASSRCLMPGNDIGPHLRHLVGKRFRLTRGYGMFGRWLTRP